MNIPQFLIAAPHSGSGKTLFTLALLRLLSNRGLKVQPFKCGPDYLDTQLHKIAAHNESYNLDLFMMDDQGIKRRYAKEVCTADAAIVEGVMGMFDGYHLTQGSSAEVAQTLSIPVILVMNAKAMAHSAAALLKGFASYQQGINLAGVVFNFVGSASHYSLLKAAAEEVGVEPLGWIAANSSLRVESRHLGLQTDNYDEIDAICENAAELILQNVNIDRLLELSSLPKPAIEPSILQNKSPRLQAAVAKDAAFNFISPANIEALQQVADITYFSPLVDKVLPKVDFVYLPGGYPELHAEQLSSNTAMIDAIRAYSNSDGRILAECGGMIYLGSHLTLKDETTYPMANIFQFGTTFANARCKLGYRQAQVGKHTIKGHEFHYSRSEGMLPQSAAEIRSATDRSTETGIYVHKNTVASYFHLYWGDSSVSIISILDAIINTNSQKVESNG